MHGLSTVYLVFINNRIYLLWWGTRVAQLHTSARQASADGSMKHALCCIVVPSESQSTEDGKIACFGSLLEVRNPAFLTAEMCTIHTVV